ncbi:MAG TPA: MsnO8 family LLM class oxidoreductase [Caulobacteraceae bacterium]|nr:MsnO8 family LLM class oxidoreductase [Caulobacteraceae bacterium]
MAALSILDLSPKPLDGPQAQGIRDTLEVARAAERLGFKRFWVAEHHSIPHLSSASPEVMLAALTQVTSTIRLGSGGVMLPNYSPLKVAETFMQLEALAPGRIDLGLGRALGADGITGRALGSSTSDVFPQLFALLSAWLLDAAGVEPFPSPHPFQNVKASPAGPSHPDLFLLCSSVDSARFAGLAGVGMVFAEFIARSDGAPAVAAYREAFQPSVYRAEPLAGVATIALAADTTEEAERLAALIPRPPSRPGERPDEERFIRRFRGDGAAVRAYLAEKAAHTGADELFVLGAGPTLPSRIRSMELVAEMLPSPRSRAEAGA